MNQSRPVLTIPQRIEFLKLVAQMASPSAFERKLNLSKQDIEYYKKQLNVENSDEASRLYRKLERNPNYNSEETILNENKKAREAEAVANQRLQALEAKQHNSQIVQVDKDKIRAEDIARQKNLEAIEEAEVMSALSQHDSWTLPLKGSEAQRNETIERFRRDIEHQGINFCTSKYGVSKLQIKTEAHRLNLKINWDRVKR